MARKGAHSSKEYMHAYYLKRREEKREDQIEYSKKWNEENREQKRVTGKNGGIKIGKDVEKLSKSGKGSIEGK